MIIKPYSSVRGDTFVAADYPACKLFLKCDEGSGNSLIEATTGNSIATGISLNWSVSNAVRMSATMSFTSLGKTITIGTKSALLFCVANFGTVASVAVGQATTTKLGALSTVYIASDGTNAAAVPGPTTGAIVGAGTAFVPGASNELTAYQASTTVWTAPANDTAEPGDLTNLGSVDNFAGTGALAGVLDLYGMALFVFDAGLPSDIKAAISWMTAEWQRGNKAIYPGWKGLA